MDRLRPQTLAAVMQQIDSNSTDSAKGFLDSQSAWFAVARRHGAHYQRDIECADRAAADFSDRPSRRSRFSKCDGACEFGAG